jgi:hypothetical protein
LTRAGRPGAIRFGGVFLQSYTNAFGFVQSSNRIGRLTITPDQ